LDTIAWSFEAEFLFAYWSFIQKDRALLDPCCLKSTFVFHMKSVRLEH